MAEGTLLFRHLPAELNVEERKELLHYLGATRVKVMGQTGRMKNTAFAVFPSKEEAAKVLKQLHQVEFLGSTLSVELAKKELQLDVPSVVDNEGLLKKDEIGASGSGKDDDQKLKTEPQEVKFDSTFNTWGLKHPRRPELRYLYPPPTPSILTNIMNALAAVPKFYVQVLHLMNKMDLPAPFGAVTPAPPLHPDVVEPALPDDIDQREMDISSESESELESGEEDEREKRLKENQPTKRLPRPLRKKPVAKRPRLSDLQDIGVPVQPSAVTVPVGDVFEQISDAGAVAKKIELKLPSSILPSTAVPPPSRAPTLPTPNLSALPPLPSSYPGRDLNLQHRVAPQPPAPAAQSYHSVPSSVSSSLMPPALPASHHQYQLPPHPPPPPPVQPSHRQLLQQQLIEQPVLFPLEKDAEQTLLGNVDKNEQPTEDGPPPVVVQRGFGILEPMHKDTEEERELESGEKEWTRSKFITSSELRKSRLSHSELKELSVFRRYDEGEPSCRLYIKNVSKQVTEEDIHWVYGRYVNWDSELETNIFDIRLMKEGRMKGQAFVTLPTEEAAKAAVKETNGFVLKEKPLVVQFARSAKAREDDTDKSQRQTER